MQDLLGSYVGFVLGDVARLLKRDFDRQTAGIGMTRSQLQVLVYLSFQDGIRQKELADTLDVSPMTLVRLLDRLEAKKLVVRRRDPADKRIRCVYLTGKHTDLQERIRSVVEQVQKKVFAGISEEEKQDMFDVLQRMQANLSRSGRLERSRSL